MNRPRPKLSKVLDEAFLEIPDWQGDTTYRLSFAMTAPHPVAVDTISRFIGKNNNNTGLHSNKEERKGTRRLEKESINMLCGYLGCGDRDGYITSGGTEGNITALWIARNQLQKNSKKIAIIASSLSHACLDKAADLLGLSVYNAKLNDEQVIDPEKIADIMHELEGEGYDGFIFYLTQGYYTTGMVDDVNRIRDNVPDSLLLKSYFHIDACLGGFVIPFTKEFDSSYFSIESVDSIALDPHKFGRMPYSCGVLLANKGKFKHITRVSGIAHNTEETLSGSRSGAVAAGLYALLRTMEVDGFVKQTETCLYLKKYFINEIRNLDPEAIIISNPLMALFSASFSKTKTLPEELTNKYRLVGLKLYEDKDDYYYNFFALPHFTKDMIDRFIKELAPHLS